MSGDDLGYAIFMLLLLGAWGVSYFYTKRVNLSDTLQKAMIWVLIFLGFIIAYGFKDVLQSQLFPSSALQSGQSVSFSRAEDGHFYANLTVNGESIEFFVDTGATAIVLNQQDAEKVGFDVENLNFFGTANTANGVVSTAQVRLGLVELGSFTDENLRASVNGGDLDISLLGMDYINLYSEFRISGNTLTLTR